MAAALFSLALAAAIGVWLGPFGSDPRRHDWLVPCLTALGAAAIALLTCAYRTHETIALYSNTGGAKLMEFTGGLGTVRALRPFMTKLAAHTRLATQARRASRSEHLRDEMREHFRLKEIGLLSTEEYEAAKTRILGQHGRG